jgi:hypothetical protein
MTWTLEEEARYEQFVAGLTALSRKYGIALTAIGGVHISDDAGDYAELRYVAGFGSGDLYPNWPVD